MNNQQDGTHGAAGGHNLSPADSYFAPTALSRAAGLGLGLAANPFSLRQEMFPRQLDPLAAASSTNGVAYPNNHDIELELLSRRENELLGLRSAHNQLIAGLGPRNNRMTADANGAAGSEDSFPNESIEAIVALQKRRHKQVEEMMGLPGHHGERVFNLLRPQNQPSALAGMASSAAQGLLTDGRGLDPSELATASYLQGLQRGIEERQALDYQNIGLAAMQRNWALAGEARMPSSALNYPNEYLRMLRQQQRQQQQLFLLQMQSLADRQGVESADPGSLCTAGTLCFH